MEERVESIATSINGISTELGGRLRKWCNEFFRKNGQGRGMGAVPSLFEMSSFIYLLQSGTGLMRCLGMVLVRQLKVIASGLIHSYPGSNVWFISTYQSKSCIYKNFFCVIICRHIGSWTSKQDSESSTRPTFLAWSMSLLVSSSDILRCRTWHLSVSSPSLRDQSEESQPDEKDGEDEEEEEPLPPPKKRCQPVTQVKKKAQQQAPSALIVTSNSLAGGSSSSRSATRVSIKSSSAADSCRKWY